MYIRLGARGEPVLEEARDFGGFKVVVEGGEGAPLDERLAPCGRLDHDGRHAWIAERWLRAAGPAEPAWREQLDAMLAYADRKGWRDGAGAIRAHLETAGA